MDIEQPIITVDADSGADSGEINGDDSKKLVVNPQQQPESAVIQPMSREECKSTQATHAKPDFVPLVRDRKPKRPMSEEEKDEHYYDLHQRNNDAAKRSRDARKRRQDAIMKENEKLKKENQEFYIVIASLLTQIREMQEALNMKSGEQQEKNSTTNTK